MCYSRVSTHESVVVVVGRSPFAEVCPMVHVSAGCVTVSEAERTELVTFCLLQLSEVIVSERSFVDPFVAILFPRKLVGAVQTCIIYRIRLM